MSDGNPGVGMGGMIVYKPVVNTGSPAKIVAHNSGDQAPVSDDSSVGSIQSIGSVGSIGSIGSVGSVLSIGSAGSVLSIGSAGSVLSIGSAGSILSIGSVGSIGSIGSAFSAGALGAHRQRALVQAGSTALAVAALFVAATAG